MLPLGLRALGNAQAIWNLSSIRLLGRALGQGNEENIDSPGFFPCDFGSVPPALASPKLSRTPVWADQSCAAEGLLSDGFVTPPCSLVKSGRFPWFLGATMRTLSCSPYLRNKEDKFLC